MGKKIELGSKHECESCGAKYYDLGVPDKPCPICGAGAEGEEADDLKKKEEE